MLPVVEVPYETPFIAIGKLVADAQSADHFTKLERLIAGHQILARALLTSGEVAATLATFDPAAQGLVGADDLVLRVS